MYNSSTFFTNYNNSMSISNPYGVDNSLHQNDTIPSFSSIPKNNVFQQNTELSTPSWLSKPSFSNTNTNQPYTNNIFKKSIEPVNFTFAKNNTINQSVTTAKPFNFSAPSQPLVTIAKPFNFSAPSQPSVTTAKPFNFSAPSQPSVTTVKPVNFSAPIQYRQDTSVSSKRIIIPYVPRLYRGPIDRVNWGKPRGYGSLLKWNKKNINPTLGRYVKQKSVIGNNCKLIINKGNRKNADHFWKKYKNVPRR